MAVVLQAASRESLRAAGDRLDAIVDSSSARDLSTLGDELFAITRLVVAQTALRRALGDPAVPEEARTGLLRDVVGTQVGETTLGVVDGLVGSRWSKASDLVEALETIARRATLAVAEKEGGLDDVEDQLFRFGRILDREPELKTLLSDTGQPEEKRAALLDTVLGDRVSPVTAALLRQTVRIPRGRHLDLAAEELAELAAARRDRYVARVSTAVALTDEQERRLADSLTRLYGRPMSLQVELDESLLGGLVVEVGGEVIDGSVAGRLAAAGRHLPS
ncbi:F0F1 ATP synthase subunit delta [Pseudonocardia sp. KRD-184]|uniref:ATP synthase subunit delta n=1 Tax=Pseudonocardia oceani TaxID=2792013 RepID=A0ABS6U5X0_9PSEU|nr:F0F1 ATP synthase subunit delta [Pseudonocardia oceani]MBW0088057.1 F0F1 ATP synthase subunit delta [Pseudonocardia oceani]MBW0098522.1 F0F1 ATP synthase subunit delta [Pseudonocardia oceani]MBW0108273.1 F0F1 ATP synthase subunit delta [Pseudonocardia oceani]MBW0122474.1 F0F1 ATP synthase subunit delta [Pseudonocardia oceani]MBW0127623.1 F0F1 ATP synthase subunit delta [Pseudonocardia oceani]